MTDPDPLPRPSVTRLTKDLKLAAATLSTAEARYLVDTFYSMQDQRIRADNQVRSLRDSPEPHATLAWLAAEAGTLEAQIKRALESYSQASVVGRWSLSIVGIGPILAAGLLAHIDITQAPTVGHIWRFAGLDPTSVWHKGERRPWNATLKLICWKLGESFTVMSKKEDDVYGKLIVARKAYEVARNDAGGNAEHAAAKLATFKIGKDTDAYKAYSAGRLPPAHLHSRAKRFGVKIFLAHWHQVAYYDKYGTLPPKPYVISQLQHGHEIVCPHWPW